LSTKTRAKADMLQWRRDKVIELRGIGLSYAEIAQQLQVSTSSIGTDVQYLREQYQVCLCALDAVLKNAFVIMTKSDDNREKLQAMQLFKDTHLIKLELLSNATTIDSALEYIKSKNEKMELTKKPSTISSTLTQAERQEQTVF
jgi:hypothetical protein